MRLIVSQESRVFIGIKKVQRGLDLETEVRPCEVYRLPVSSVLDRFHSGSFSSHLKFSSPGKTALNKKRPVSTKKTELQTSSRFELWVSNKAFLGKDFHQKGRQSTTHARRDYLEAPIAVIIGVGQDYICG